MDLIQICINSHYFLKFGGHIVFALSFEYSGSASRLQCVPTRETEARSRGAKDSSLIVFLVFVSSSSEHQCRASQDYLAVLQNTLPFPVCGQPKNIRSNAHHNAETLVLYTRSSLCIVLLNILSFTSLTFIVIFSFDFYYSFNCLTESLSMISA